MNKKYLLAYTAGIIDGEGCILIARSTKRKTGKTYHQLQVIVTSSNLCLCEWLKMQYGGSITDDKRYLCRSAISKNVIYKWFLTSSAASEFIKMVSPYLYLKKPQAELAVYFQEGRGLNAKLTESQKASRESDYILMRELKV